MHWVTIVSNSSKAIIPELYCFFIIFLKPIVSYTPSFTCCSHSLQWNMGLQLNGQASAAHYCSVLLTCCNCHYSYSGLVINGACLCPLHDYSFFFLLQFLTNCFFFFHVWALLHTLCLRKCIGLAYLDFLFI